MSDETTRMESAFLAEIAAASASGDRVESLGLRGIFADWLEEKGRDADAAAIRQAVFAAQNADDAAALTDNLASLWPSPAGMEGMSDHQKVELAHATIRPFGMLIGGPGTGKTRCLSNLVLALVNEHGSERVAVAAPTGKAAVRATQALRERKVGGVRASTIHQLLEVSRSGRDGHGWGFLRNATNPLAQAFVIVDEVSMLDTSLAAALFSALRPGHHVLFVGDIGQLPPVGHGSPLRDLLAAGLPTGYLTEIHRNAGLIVQACDAMRRRSQIPFALKYEREKGMNLMHVEAATPTEQIAKLGDILGRMREHGSFDVRDDVQILTAVNDEKKSPLARSALNKMLQARLNPSGELLGGYRLDDKVICLRNQWLQGGDLLANGDIGHVSEIDAARKAVVVTFRDPTREATLSFATQETRDAAARDFALAWSVTCHKSQGSEWRCVIVMIDTSPAAKHVASREFWYTAISRARELTITIGRNNAMQWQAKKPRLDRRKTFLTDLLLGRKSA